MTGLAYLAIFGTIAAVHFLHGRVLYEDPRFTIYDLSYLLVTIITTIAVVARGSRERREAMGVLWAVYIWYWINDMGGLPESTAAMANVAVGAYFILTMQERWQWLAGFCFALMPTFTFAAGIGLMPGYGQCGPAFLPFCMPIALWALGIIATMAVGLASDDGVVEREDRSDPVGAWLAGRSPVVGFFSRAD